MWEREIKKDLKWKTDRSTDHLPPPLKCAQFSLPHDEDFDSDPLLPFSAWDHYQISNSMRDFLNLPCFLAENSDNNTLIVSNCSHHLMELNHQIINRMLIEIYITIFWHKFLVVNSMAMMAIHSLMKTVLHFASIMVASTGTRQQE